jgi:hypothetical protein
MNTGAMLLAAAGSGSAMEQPRGVLLQLVGVISSIKGVGMAAHGIERIGGGKRQFHQIIVAGGKGAGLLHARQCLGGATFEHIDTGKAGMSAAQARSMAQRLFIRRACSGGIADILFQLAKILPGQHKSRL